MLNTRNTCFLALIMVFCILCLNASSLLAEDIKVTSKQNEQKKTSASPATASFELSHKQAKLLQNVIAKIKEEYPVQLEDKELVENAMRGVVDNLDLYSSYISPEELKLLREDKGNNFIGIGVDCFPSKIGNIKCVPYYNGPAYLAGMRAGDAIIAIDGERIANYSNDQVLKRLRGNAGTRVAVEVQTRENKAKLLSIVRSAFTVPQARWKLLLNSRIGYIKITEISSSSASNIKHIFTTLKDIAQKSNSSLEGIIIDLRDNLGGDLESAITIADMFLSKVQKIVIYETKRGTVRNTRYSNGNDISDGIPIVVLVNQNTASASEVIAAALQENHRALLVGNKTYGKACIQKIIPFENGSAMRLVVGVFYTPNGHMIQSLGIKPDIFVPEAVVIKVPEYELSRRSSTNARDSLKIQKIVEKSGEAVEKANERIKNNYDNKLSNGESTDGKTHDSSSSKTHDSQISHHEKNAQKEDKSKLNEKFNETTHDFDKANGQKIKIKDSAEKENITVNDNKSNSKVIKCNLDDDPFASSSRTLGALEEKIDHSDYKILAADYTNDFQLLRAIDILSSMIFYRCNKQ